MIIFEGPDGGGKTTLAATFAEAFRLRILHHGPALDLKEAQLFDSYLDSLLQARAVMDRSWLSERIYGEAFRGGQDRLGSRIQILEQVAQARKVIVICCLPSWELVRDCWRKRYADGAEYVTNELAMQHVHHSYGSLHLHTTLPVIYYDREKPSTWGALLKQIEERGGNWISEPPSNNTLEQLCCPLGDNDTHERA